VFDSSSFNQVMSFIDASFATHEDGKGQSGCFLFLGNMLVHEACRKQRIVTKNSTEAELVALSDYIDEGTLLEDFIMELGTLFDEGGHATSSVPRQQINDRISGERGRETPHKIHEGKESLRDRTSQHWGGIHSLYAHLEDGSRRTDN